MQPAPSRHAFIPNGTANAGPAPISLTGTAARPLLRAAFYGRSNNPYLGHAGQRIARQFQTCRTACSGRAELVRYFYDIQSAIRIELHRIPQFLHGPPEYHGGWLELAELVPEDKRDFDVVVCVSPDRVTRRINELKESVDFLTGNRVPLISVEGGWREATSMLWDLTSGINHRPDPELTGNGRNSSVLRSPRERQ